MVNYYKVFIPVAQFDESISQIHGLIQNDVFSHFQLLLGRGQVVLPAQMPQDGIGLSDFQVT